MPTTPEGFVLSACLEFLAVRGVFAWRNNSGATKTEGGRFVRFGLRGSSDILGILPGGRFLAVECKAPKGRTTPDQEAFLTDIRRRGGVAMVARSVDDLAAGLKEAGCK